MMMKRNHDFKKSKKIKINYPWYVLKDSVPAIARGNQPLGYIGRYHPAPDQSSIQISAVMARFRMLVLLFTRYPSYKKDIGCIW